MKKLLTALLLIAPLSLSACGMMVFIAGPNSNFLQKTSDMDHSSILDFNNGVEDMWFTIQKPKEMLGGSILTVVPIPADTSKVIVEEVEKNELPDVSHERQINYTDLFIHLFPTTYAVITLILPYFFAISFIILAIATIIISVNKRKNKPNPIYLKKTVYSSSFTLTISLIVFFALGFLGSIFSIGVDGGNGPHSIIAMPTIGITPQQEDKITVTYSTTTATGVTMQVISAENGRGLTDYLERNGLPKAPSNEQTLSQYINRKMNFVITQIPSESITNGSKKYIHIAFPNKTIFFPLAVNYVDSEIKHPVTILVLKPVTINGFSTSLKLLENDNEYNSHTNNDIRNLNKVITYYGYTNSKITSSLVHIYDKEKNYYYDIEMSVGVSTYATFITYIFNPYLFTALILIIIMLFEIFIIKIIEKKSKIIRIIFVGASLILPFFVIVIILKQMIQHL